MKEMWDFSFSMMLISLSIILMCSVLVWGMSVPVCNFSQSLCFLSWDRGGSLSYPERLKTARSTQRNTQAECAELHNKLKSSDTLKNTAGNKLVRLGCVTSEKKIQCCDKSIYETFRQENIRKFLCLLFNRTQSEVNYCNVFSLL